MMRLSLIRGFKQIPILIFVIGGVLFSGCDATKETKQKKELVDAQNHSGSSTREQKLIVSAGPINLLSNQVTYQSKDDSTTKLPTNGTAAGEWGAVSGFGEIAPRNFRGSGTYGVYFTPTQRFKVSAEYLTQELSFSYTSGHHKKWVSQVAAGIEYQYLLDQSVFKSIEMGTAYSHAFGRHLSSKEIKKGAVKRHIASSNGSLSYLGTTTRLWDCAFLSAAIDYDWVRFDRKYQHDKLSNGFGGSIDFVQQFAKDFSLNLGAEFRQPFNAFQGSLNWNRRVSNVNFDIGIFGNLTNGHDGVRDIRTVGVQLGLSFGPKAKSCGRSVDMSTKGKDCYARQYCDVSQWVATPAVYVPVVLTIADQELLLTSGCNGSPPVLLNPLASVSITNASTPPFDTSTYFSSSLPLTYSLSVPGLPTANYNAVIDPVTGVITFTWQAGPDTTFNGTVTATSACGSAVLPIDLRFYDP